MQDMDVSVKPKYFFFGLMLIALVFATAIFWPFFTILVLAASVAIVLYPVREWFHKKLPKHNGWLSALCTVIIFVFIVCVPLVFAGAIIVDQSTSLYYAITDGSSSGEYIERINASINKVLPDEFGPIAVEEKIADLAGTISQNVAQIFSATLQTILSFLLLILASFYFLKDGHEWKKRLVTLAPIPKEDSDNIFSRLGDAINGVVRGYLLIGLAQGILMGVGLAIFGVPNAALFGLLAGIASLIPSIGTALVGVPVIIFLFATGQTGAGIGFTLWALVLVGLVDNILNPILVGRRIHIPPLIVLFSVLGGIVLMGPVGILIGPLVVSFLFALVSIYKKRKTE